MPRNSHVNARLATCAASSKPIISSTSHWAADLFSAEDRALLSRSIANGLRGPVKLLEEYVKNWAMPVEDAHALGLVDCEQFVATARQVIATDIIEPLRARGLDVVDLPGQLNSGGLHADR